MKKPTFYRFLILGIFLFCGFVAEAHLSKRDTTIYVVADKMPTFPGGARVQYQFLAMHLHYPLDAFKNHITGRVIVAFIVERNGKISNIRVLKGLGHGCDKEAMRVVSEMPKWIPGRIKGKAVRVRVTLPFLFNLQPKNKVYSQADKYPVFIYEGGSLKNYLNNNIKYPVGIVKNKITDTVKVFFIVEPDRRVTHVMVKKDTSKLNAYDYEAMRLAKKLRVFEPAYVNQYPVRLNLFLKVPFDYREVDTAAIKKDTVVYGKTFSYYLHGYKEQVFRDVEKMPTFPGGEYELMNYLAEHIRYPEVAKKRGKQGRVFLNFIVEPDGSIDHVKVLRGVCLSIDAEAVRVVTEMPKWNPGIQKGKPVRVSFNLPIKFTLQ